MAETAKTARSPDAVKKVKPVSPLAQANGSTVEVKGPSSSPFTARRMPKPEDIEFINIMLYGKAGAGKTTLAASADDLAWMSDVLYIDVDVGKMSIMNRGEIVVIDVDSFQMLSRVYDYLRVHVRYRDQNNEAELERTQEQIGLGGDRIFRFRTVILDTLTEVQTLVMADVLGINPKRMKLDADRIDPDGSHWNANSEKVRDLLTKFRDLRMNFIAICHEKMEIDKQKRQSFYPSLPGQLAKRSQAYFDVVAYMPPPKRHSSEEEEGKKERKVIYQLLTSPGSAYEAKNRMPGSPERIENPTMALLTAPLNKGA